MSDCLSQALRLRRYASTASNARNGRERYEGSPLWEQKFLRDVVTGMSDGLTVPFAQVSFKAHSPLVSGCRVGKVENPDHQ
jgi:hypothetical protein